MSSKVGFWLRRAAVAFKPACIAQLIQVELLRRRLRLTQMQGASLPNSQLLNSFVYKSMENTLQKQHTLPLFVLLTFLGCGLITLCSWVKIPFYPVPFTLQTLAISLLALTQSPKQAFASVLCYLGLASLGLPVLCGKANPLWLCGISGGYLIGFPMGAYLASKLSQRWHPVLALLCGQALIYLLGFVWLVPLFGAKASFIHGVAFFLPSELLKILAAWGISRWLAKSSIL